MLVTPLKDFAADFLMEQPGYHRGAGLHMSDIYGALYQELEPNRYKTGTPMDPVRVGAGLAFEQMLEEGLRRRIPGERPGEIMSPEGILCSPDFLFFNGATRVGEFKATWASLRGWPTTEGMDGIPVSASKWMTQIMAYCHLLETADARLIVYFVNGNYVKPLAPQLKAWDITFSRREMEDNWAMLINFARYKKLL